MPAVASVVGLPSCAAFDVHINVDSAARAASRCKVAAQRTDSVDGSNQTCICHAQFGRHPLRAPATIIARPRLPVFSFFLGVHAIAGIDSNSTFGNITFL